MKRAWLMIGAGFLLFCAGFPAIFDWPRHWWFVAFYVTGLPMMIIGRRRHDLLVYQDETGSGPQSRRRSGRGNGSRYGGFLASCVWSGGWPSSSTVR
jgi:hypothetical protein